MNSKLLLSTFFSLLFSIAGFSQRLYFAQYNQMSALLNPALVGTFESEKRNQLSLNYRTRANGLYQTTLLSYEHAIKFGKDRLAIGVAIFDDRIGTTINSNIQAVLTSLSYKKQIGINHSLRLGLGTSSAHRKILGKDLWLIPLPEGAMGISQNRNFFESTREGPPMSNSMSVYYVSDFNIGFVWASQQPNGNLFEFGVAFYGHSYNGYSNLRNRTYNSSRRMHIHTKYKIELSEKLAAIPTLMYSESEDFLSYLLDDTWMIGSDFELELDSENEGQFLWGAHWRRWEYTFVTTLGYKNTNLRLQANYEFNLEVDRFNARYRNAIELSCAWLF